MSVWSLLLWLFVSAANASPSRLAWLHQAELRTLTRYLFRLPARNRHEVSLAHNPKVTEALLDNIKLVRYQINPQANWGPARAAIRGAPPPK